MLVDYRIRQREYLLAIGRALTAELDLADVLRIIVQGSTDFDHALSQRIVGNSVSAHTASISSVLVTSRPWWSTR